MAINFSDLPPKYQEQAMQKIVAQLKKKSAAEEKTTRSKYGNVKTERAAIRFDSKKEAARFDQLMLMQASGQIKNLRLQVEFTLQPAYTTTDGERVRAIRYLADFTYLRRDGDTWEYVVEDVKSRATKTKVYEMKKKMMVERLGVTITEI